MFILIGQQRRFDFIIVGYVMTINHIGTEEIARRKSISDSKSNTDALTFESSNNNARGAAYKRNREKLEAIEINNLMVSTVEKEMLAELEDLENEYINGE